MRNVEAISRNPEHTHLDWVREYYSLTLEGQPDSRPRAIIDDCCYDFIFYKEGRGQLSSGPTQAILEVPYRVFTVHGLKPPYRFHFEGALSFFTIKVQPWTNNHFFGEIRHPGVRGLQSIYPELTTWHDRIFNAPGIEARFAIAEQLVSGLSRPLSSDSRWVQQVCQEIYAAGGMISVHDLAEQFETSRQHLGKLFKREVRYPLKHFILTVRMMELVKFRMKAPEVSLTELAYRFDYFDQSHFIRDFRKFCGVTPKQFFAAPPEFLERH